MVLGNHEGLNDVDTLVEKIKKSNDERQGLFVELTDEHKQKLENLEPHLRMKYILTTLVVKKDRVRVIESRYKLPEGILNTLLKNIEKKLPENNKGEILEKISKALQYAINYVEMPIIYDYKRDHQLRRIWRSKMSDVFDDGENTGPFHDYYSKNKLRGQNNTHILTIFPVMLKNSGIRSQKLDDLMQELSLIFNHKHRFNNEQYYQLPSMRKGLITTKITKLLREYLLNFGSYDESYIKPTTKTKTVGPKQPQVQQKQPIYTSELSWLPDNEENPLTEKDLF